MQTAHIKLPDELRASLRRDYTASLDTQLVQAIRPVTAPLPAVRGLPRDKQGRPYILVKNPYEHPLMLVIAAVERFVEVEKRYPTIILLSVQHYYSYGYAMRAYYYRQGKQTCSIKYSCEDEFSSYDILVKGDPDV